MRCSLIFLLISILVLACVPVNADKTQEDKEEHIEQPEHEDKDHNRLPPFAEFVKRDSKRENKFKVEKGKFEVESTPLDGSKDRFSLKMETEGDKIEVDFKKYTTSIATASRFRIRFYTIQEYLEGGAAPGLDANDTLCNSYAIRGGKNFVLTDLGTSKIGTTTVRKVQGSTNDNMFFFVITMAGDGTNAPAVEFAKDKRIVLPTSIKMDIGIDATSFPYKASSGNETRLALVAFTKSKTKVKSRTETNESRATSVTFGVGATPDAFFSWASTVQVNGNATDTAAVIPSALVEFKDDDDDGDDKEATEKVTFAFDVARPKSLLWDPEFGFGEANSSMRAVASLSLVVACFIALFLGYDY